MGASSRVNGGGGVGAGLAKTGTVTKKSKKMSPPCRVFAVVLCHFHVKKKKNRRRKETCHNQTMTVTPPLQIGPNLLARSLPEEMKQNHT